MMMIKFADGRRMPWDTYRRMMLARPPGAMDQALGVTRATSALPAAGSDRRRKIGRDQQKPLNRTYCDATRQYLVEHGLSPDDVDTVMQVLGNYTDDPDDEPEAAEDERAGLGAAAEHAKEERVGLAGAGKQAQDRRRQMAQDQYLPPELRRWPVPPMSRRQRDEFEKRFPGVEKIKIL